MDARTSQRRIILEHLKCRGPITSKTAFEEYGVTRLSSIIFDLRHNGFDIVSVPTKGIDRLGHPVRFARYVLEED